MISRNIPRPNRSATTAPTVNDDITGGYAVGSIWNDVTNDISYECLDNTDGAAVWQKRIAGPTSSTDETIMRWDGTDGNTVQDGTTAENDNGIVTQSGQSVSRMSLITANQTIPDTAITRVMFNNDTFDVQSETNITTKTGTADATEASKLHDADGGFAASDVGAWIWNTTDDTYTQVSGFVDSGELNLADNIMVDTEGYILYHATFTATVDGLYLIIPKLKLVDGGADKSIIGYVYVNGSSQMQTIGYSPFATADPNTQPIVAVELSANDVVDIRAYQNNGAVADLWAGASYTTCSIIKVA